VCIFSARDVAKNVRERSNGGKEKQEGLIAKLNANNLSKEVVLKHPCTPCAGYKPDGEKDKL
jgi:hypothetical protein